MGTQETTMGKTSKKAKNASRAMFEDGNWAVQGEQLPAGTPQGWHGLYVADQFLVKQSINWMEAVTNGCCEAANHYVILNKQYQTVYVAEEESGCCARACCAPNHNFAVQIRDRSTNPDEPYGGLPVIGFYHPMKCAPCCCVCCNMCQHEMFVYQGSVPGDVDDRPCCGPPENPDSNNPLIGVLRQPVCGGVYRPTIQLMEATQDDTVEKGGIKEKEASEELVGPFMCIGSCCESKFHCQAPGQHDEHKGQYGKIKKEGCGDAGDAFREIFTDADNFKLKFEKEAPFMLSEGDWQFKMRAKARLLAGLILLDYMFFEGDGAFECCPDPDTICRLKCCDLYCCGALVPCYIRLPANSDD